MYSFPPSALVRQASWMFWRSRWAWRFRRIFDDWQHTIRFVDYLCPTIPDFFSMMRFLVCFGAFFAPFVGNLSEGPSASSNGRIESSHY
jgi:hypothetical protein